MTRLPHIKDEPAVAVRIPTSGVGKGGRLGVALSEPTALLAFGVPSSVRRAERRSATAPAKEKARAAGQVPRVVGGVSEPAAEGVLGFLGNRRPPARAEIRGDARAA